MLIGAKRAGTLVTNVSQSGSGLEPRTVGVNFRSKVVVKQQLVWKRIVIMSNNNASNNLIIAQRAVKQLRLEASVRRIKVQSCQLS